MPSTILYLRINLDIFKDEELVRWLCYGIKPHESAPKVAKKKLYKLMRAAQKKTDQLQSNQGQRSKNFIEEKLAEEESLLLSRVRKLESRVRKLELQR